MAEIRRQRERRNAGLWLLILAVAGLAAWGVWMLVDVDDEVAVADAPAAPAPVTQPVALIPAEPLATTTVLVVDPVAVAGAVRAYAAHVESDVSANGNHLYSAEGISRLGTALAAIVGREPGPDHDVVAKANAFFVVAKLLVASPDSLRLHADWMHQAAQAAVDAMDELAAKRFSDAPGLKGELEHARRAADAIRPERGLMMQRNEVRQFFRETEDALRVMGERASTQAVRDA
ncbi:MAG TPA: hypothetical protein VFS20_10855 [Longimicrobium sp.]|nr:hypothetical protein [Longimicrobium sp.]